MNIGIFRPRLCRHRLCSVLGRPGSHGHRCRRQPGQTRYPSKGSVAHRREGHRRACPPGRPRGSSAGHVGRPGGRRRHRPVAGLRRHAEPRQRLSRRERRGSVWSSRSGRRSPPRAPFIRSSFDRRFCPEPFGSAAADSRSGDRGRRRHGLRSGEQSRIHAGRIGGITISRTRRRP